MKILKFGGKSLANGEPIKNVIEIIRKESLKDSISVVVSARAHDTDLLLKALQLAEESEDFTELIQGLIHYHKEMCPTLSFDFEYSELFSILSAIRTLGLATPEIQDRVVAFGEMISTKVVAHLLLQEGLKAQRVDARNLFVTKKVGDGHEIIQDPTEKNVVTFWETLPKGVIPIVTGFIASDVEGRTTTLGRNGSNYSATLLAKYLGASEVQNWTNIDGLYTANPKWVPTAQKIDALTYKEANELAQFGANVLHAKTILPLVEKGIPLVIKNSFAPENSGTVINSEGQGKGIKAVNVIQDCALISIEGKGMLGKVGIDARIFSVLSHSGISIRLITQASSERSIGFVTDAADGKRTLELLEKEFETELLLGTVSSINCNPEIAIISITGRHNYALEKAISGLRKNKIWLHLIANSINGEHISLVISNQDIVKAVNVVHNQVFGAIKTLNVFSLGKGTVGKTLIKQILDTSESLVTRRKLKIKVVGVANSKSRYFNVEGLQEDWETQLNNAEKSNNLFEIIEEIAASNLENVVFIDNTANSEVASSYSAIVQAGFDIIASNKIANTLQFGAYQSFRKLLQQKKRNFFYETNVGAGLPIIDTIKQMVQSDEEITAIRGVFSGSLSYIFNRFSEEDISFGNVVLAAKKLGYTEPDPREDLGGNDVARKLLILAREIGFTKNLEDIEVDNLIPEELRSVQRLEDFESNIEVLSTHFEKEKLKLNNGQVLRYVGDLNKDGRMKVSLITCEKGSPLANLKGADSLIEIYTTSYGEKPIIIQGAGAGASVTARGVYSDLVRMGTIL